MDKIMTDRPIMCDRAKITGEIGEFWNKTSKAFQTIWGPHIHHGYYENSRETPVEAQEKLIEKLLDLVEIHPKDKILDAGCGMGGSSLYLAKKFDVDVSGVTLSQKQVEIATALANKDGIRNVSFKVEDALSLASFSDNSFDIVWSLESCEQFFNKQVFFQQAFRVLKPGGRLMLATWCSDADEYSGPQARRYKKLCLSMQLPYMPTIDRYARLLQQTGFMVDQKLDWSSKVKETWAMGLANMRKYSYLEIFRMSGWRGLLFMKPVKLMEEAFNQDKVKYGVFLAHKF